MAAGKKSKTEKPPPIDKLLIPAIGVVIAFVAYYFMKGISTEIPRIDVTDELALREVFFGEGEGRNYVILCHTLPGEGSNNQKKAFPISSVFQDSMDELHSNNNMIAQFSLMDCTHKLPSGKTIQEKFNLDLKKRPTIFVSGKVGPPKQVPETHLKTGHMLTKVLKGMLEPHAAKIETTKDLKSKCLNKSICALLLKGGTPPQALKDAFKNLLSTYEEVQFASVDSQTLLLTGLEEYLPEYQPGHHRFVVFKKISGGIDSKDGRLITSIAPMEDVITYNNMSNLVNQVNDGTVVPQKLSGLPQVKTRSKKLEDQERAKRERHQKKKEENSKHKSTSSSSSSGSSANSENDGSKEGRRAERERRRAEHRTSNPNYREKTPEELAEMEKQRRARMEEESKKWNIEGDDSSEAGGGGGGDGDDYQDFDNDDEFVEDLDEEEDGEVLDLD
mmetsp:Transcript_8144/g.15334  ORF Transcript_8144/g.15334 Transcript_8144/m.15334 type:complete len:446 (+) Transcript_8144:216-1553(+)|eukprot:CAMPEP_0176488760 /NCGR_PEP_ID=MMETSP0200_2-20121128/6895_1 /TAXON_ID=947934 /ORGANISM="Chaetoceros sp., Strain GSL56" /LENGTH=445 /DNA_ID=CAMNT_0017885793 /DNA_START=153 /DNA_END=1490 /DNA_ORIENTATION=-